VGVTRGGPPAPPNDATGWHGDMTITVNTCEATCIASLAQLAVKERRSKLPEMSVVTVYYTVQWPVTYYR